MPLSPRDAAKSAAARLALALRPPARRHRGRILAVTFHRVLPDDAPPGGPMANLAVRQSDFRRILAFLARRYAPLSPAGFAAGRIPPDRPSLLVTFDDGWADNHAHALPVLRALGIPAIVFLATGAVADRTPFWWQPLAALDPPPDVESLKTLPPDALEARAAAALAALPPDSFRRDFLTPPQIAEMAATGLFCFGLHGHRHAILPALSPAAARADLARNRDHLARIVPPAALLPLLAWPNGDPRTDLDLPALGLRAAFSTRRGTFANPWQKDPFFAEPWQNPSSPLWHLPRNNVDRRLAATPALYPWLLLRA